MLGPLLVANSFLFHLDFDAKIIEFKIVKEEMKYYRPLHLAGRFRSGPFSRPPCVSDRGLTPGHG